LELTETQHPQTTFVSRPAIVWPPGPERFIRFALLAFILMLPFAIERSYQRPSVGQAFYVKLAGLSVAMFAVLVIAAMRLPLHRPTALFWAYLVYLAVILTSVWLQEYRGFALAEAIFPITGAGLLLVLEITPFDRRRQESFFLVFMALGLVSALYGLLQNFGVEFIDLVEAETERQVIVSFFGHSNFMGSFLAPIVFLAAYFLEPRRSIRLYVLAVATIAAILLCLYWAGTRAATLGVLVGAVAVLRWRLPRLSPDRRRATAVVAFFVIVALAGALWGQYRGRHRETLFRRLSSYREIRNRLYLWIIAIDMIRDHPLAGIGYGRYDTEFWLYAERHRKQPGNEVYGYILREINGLNPGQAHNDLIEVASETGIPGAAALIALWILALLLCQTCVRRGPPPDERLGRYLRAALLCFFVDSQFGFPLQLPASAVVFWVLLGNVAQTYRRAAMSAPQPATAAAAPTDPEPVESAG
jgi:O-antigen ligase